MILIKAKFLLNAAKFLLNAFDKVIERSKVKQKFSNLLHKWVKIDFVHKRKLIIVYW